MEIKFIYWVGQKFKKKILLDINFKLEMIQFKKHLRNKKRRNQSHLDSHNSRI